MNEALDRIVHRDTSIAASVNWELLRQHTRRVPSGYLRGLSSHSFPWHQINHLYILGCNETDEVIKMSPEDIQQPGCYMDKSEKWLLVIGAPIKWITKYISSCTNTLQHLVVWFTTLESLDLEHLRGLTNLDISDNRKLSRLVLPDTQSQLQSLDLSFTAIGPLLDLNGRSMLKTLCLDHSQIRSIQLNHSLPELFLISARHIPLHDSAFLQHLPGLTRLNLYGTNVTDISFIQYCTKLKSMRLDCTHVTSLPSLNALEKLDLIDLSGTPIADLDSVQFPPNLKYLYLENTAIQSIPPGIRHLTKLFQLGLSNLQLNALPVWLPDWLKENNSLNIHLNGATIEGMDTSVFDQPWEVVRQWLIERKYAEFSTEGETGNPLNELKVVFLGDGGAGKSYTIARLLADGEQPETFDGNSTPGIVIKDKQYHIGDRDVQIHFWDFGGQEILHSMHRMFLTDRTLYVVLLNVRDGTQDERARYWLHNIKSFAPNAPVLLVLNQMDENPNASINENDLKSVVPGMTETVKMSALKYSADEFNAVFTSALLRQIGKMSETLDFFFPAAWTKVKHSLRTMEDHYIHGDKYNALCQECGVKDEGDLRKGLLKWFNDLGVSFCYGDARLEDYVILRPDWLTNAIYILLFNKIENVRNGIVPLDDIYRILRLESADGKEVRSVLTSVTYSRDEVSYVLEVVRKFRLCFQLNDNEVFIPMLCNRNSLPIAAEYENDSNALEFRMEYDYLPNNVLHRLMVELRGHLDTRQVWLTGARFFQDSTGLSAVVKTEGNNLRIFVRSANAHHKANTYLSFIKDALDHINRDMGLTPPSNLVVYKANGIKDEFDYDDLINALEDGEKTYRSPRLRKRISIDDILNQTGPKADPAQEKLLRDIFLACASMQSQKLYWNLPDDEKGSKEDIRNDYIRNYLRAKGYTVSDQSRSGTGSKGKRAGELDMDIRLVPDAPYTIYEALNISDTADKSKWNEHLHKLLINYNPNGLPFLFLVSYLECSRKDFPQIADAYDYHMRWHDPKDCERVRDSFSTLNEDHGQFIRIAKCTYYCGVPTTVYHLCVRLGN